MHSLWFIYTIIRKITPMKMKAVIVTDENAFRAIGCSSKREPGEGLLFAGEVNHAVSCAQSHAPT